MPMSFEVLLTKNQSGRRKNCRTQSATSTIFKMATTEQELSVFRTRILAARIDSPCRSGSMLSDKQNDHVIKRQHKRCLFVDVHIIYVGRSCRYVILLLYR